MAKLVDSSVHIACHAFRYNCKGCNKLYFISLPYHVSPFKALSKGPYMLSALESFGYSGSKLRRDRGYEIQITDVKTCKVKELLRALNPLLRSLCSNDEVHLSNDEVWSEWGSG